ncbi:MAG: hypothetical protein JWO45_1833 [Spartobacteria bacterium]|nr:hypothetical protein [Spartobacteria bacterium]
MAERENEVSFVTPPIAKSAEIPGRSTIYLRNGLCVTNLFHDALQFGVLGSPRETFQRAIVAAGKLHPKQRFPGHEVLEEIGRGGMGVIYTARELKSPRIVALKCLLAADATSDELLTRFRREAETAATLQHPNIVPVYCVGESDDELPFFTMKFISGGNLQEARDQFATNPRRAVRLILKVALALQYAHERGVLHRDLKPANILVDAGDEPLVADFGLARWFNDSSDLTRTLAVFGTAGYIAPEQLSKSATDLNAATDIYSLGVILFELLSGKPPFRDTGSVALIRPESVPRLRSIAPHLDRDLEVICAHCLEREPSARYPSAAACAHDLANWLDRRPITARPVGPGVLLSRWISRNRALAFIISMLIVLAAVLVVWQGRVWNLQSAVRETTMGARSIVVIPFLDLDRITPDPLLSKLVANSLQQELNRLGPARVGAAPSGSSGEWARREDIRKASQRAHARTVLTGAERTIDGKKKITLRLLDGATGEPLLVGVFPEAKFTREVYAILSAKDFSEIKLKADPGLHNQSAREAILAGRELMFRYTKSDLDRAIDLFKKAARLTPQSSLAHSYLAMAATVRTHYVADWSYLKLGREEALEALRLSQNSGEAHRALAGVYYQEGRLAEALEQGMKTIETSGTEEKTARFIGMTFDTLGRPDHALNWFHLALRLRETPGDVEAQIGDCWVKLGDDHRALEAYARSVELQPDRPQGAVGICHTRMLAGDFEVARKLYQAKHWNHEDLADKKAIAAQVEFFGRNFNVAGKLYNELAAADPDGGGAFYGAVSYQSALGRSKQATGDARDGNEILERCLSVETAVIERQPENPEPVYRLAAIESSLGRLDRSIDHLRTAVRLGWIDYRSLAIDPRFDAIRPIPEYKRILNDLSVKVENIKAQIRN